MNRETHSELEENIPTPAVWAVEDWCAARVDALIRLLETPPLWLQIIFFFCVALLIFTCGLLFALATPDTTYPR